MRFSKLYFQKTALHLAVEKENLDMINLLLSYDGIEINIIDDILKNHLNKVFTQKVL